MRLIEDGLRLGLGKREEDALCVLIKNPQRNHRTNGGNEDAPTSTLPHRPRSYTDPENIQRKELMWEVIENETEEQRQKRLV